MKLPTKKSEPESHEIILKANQAVLNDSKPTLATDITILEAKDKGQIQTNEGLKLFTGYIKEKFPEELLANMIYGLATASDTKSTKTGDTYETPNHNAREKGIKLALQYRGFMSMPSENQNKAPKIIFNVVPPKSKNFLKQA